MAKNEVAVADAGDPAADGVSVTKPSPLKILQNAISTNTVLTSFGTAERILCP